MKLVRTLAIAFAAIAWTGLAAAQAQPPQNVLNLSTTGTVEVAQDLITISLAASRDGPDANGLQAQLKSLLEAALTEAKKSAQPGQVDVRTGLFNVGPRYTTGGKIDGWRGTVELVLEGRDFARITQAAGKIPGMTVASVAFGLSREQRAKVEGDAQHIAIERFKAKATELARSFGFAGYTLREVSVNSNDFTPGPRPMMMARAAQSAESSPVPVEAGKSAVTVTVSGSVQLK
ncbi:SIMPL domain-containing protein [Ramlibacter sp. PS4R-6]|uniref:SIMPL domain-containing protein n=1 Tax=Ramlibacter sp. PS4R-6 TaxID=3133438 RepID=UPI0030AD1CAE